MDFAEAVPFFFKQIQILLGRSPKNAKKKQISEKVLEGSGHPQDFLWDLSFFAFFGDLPSKILGFCKNNGTASAKSIVF